MVQRYAPRLTVRRRNCGNLLRAGAVLKARSLTGQQRYYFSTFATAKLILWPQPPNLKTKPRFCSQNSSSSSHSSVKDNLSDVGFTASKTPILPPHNFLSNIPKPPVLLTSSRTIRKPCYLSLVKSIPHRTKIACETAIHVRRERHRVQVPLPIVLLSVMTIIRI